jgi:hypothetical protein
MLKLPGQQSKGLDITTGSISHNSTTSVAHALYSAGAELPSRRKALLQDVQLAVSARQIVVQQPCYPDTLRTQDDMYHAVLRRHRHM